MYPADESQSLHLDVFPTPRSIEGHRIGVARIEPTDCTCADSGQDDSLFVSGPKKVIYTEPPPDAHHIQRVSAAHVNDVCRKDLSFDVLCRGRLAHEPQHIRF